MPPVKPTSESTSPLTQRMFAFLRQTPLFESFTDQELNALIRFLEVRRMGAGEIVFRENDPGDSCFIVAQGRIALGKTLSDGRARPLGSFEPGTMFGQVALVDGSPRSAGAVAETDGLLLELRKDTFDRLFHSAHPVAYKFQAVVVGILSQQLRMANANLARVSTAIAKGDELDVREALESLTAAQRAVEEGRSVDGKNVGSTGRTGDYRVSPRK